MAEYTSRINGRNKFLKKDGVYYILNTETRPTTNDGVIDGDNLFIIDTGETFIYYKGVWRVI